MNSEGLRAHTWLQSEPTFRLGIGPGARTPRLQPGCRSGLGDRLYPWLRSHLYLGSKSGEPCLGVVPSQIFWDGVAGAEPLSSALSGAGWALTRGSDLSPGAR